MATNNSINGGTYFGDNFTASGFNVINRTVTGHHADGSAHFIVRDNGDHRCIRRAKDMEASEVVLYSTFGSPVDINNEDDINAAQKDWPVSEPQAIRGKVHRADYNQGGHHVTNGSRVTILDFAPGAESPMHRGESIDYNLVLEGEIELILDSGEVTTLRRGDFNVQRSTAHKWRNVTDSGKGPARLFNVLLDIKTLVMNGKDLKGFF